MTLEESTAVVRDGMHWYWDHDAQPCSLDQWMREFDNRFRIETVVGGTKVISAYLGMNDGMPLPVGEEPMAVFGTLVGEREIPSPTRAHAEDVHAAEVARLRKALQESPSPTRERADEA